MISAALKDFVRNNDLIAIRGVLQSKILMDHDMEFGDFDENLKFCLQNGISEDELFVRFDDSNPISDEVSQENFKAMYSYLGVNFSKERVECLKKITKALWPEEQKVVAPKAETAVVGGNSFDGDERIVAKSEKKIIPTRQEVSSQPDSNSDQKPNIHLHEGETLDSYSVREIPVERKEIPSAPQKNSNTQQRKTRTYERKPGYDVYNEKRSAASGAAMTSETKALIAVGAIVLLAATVYIVSK